MKKTKLFLFALLALAMIVGSCSGDGETGSSHTHNFEGEWKSDGAGHWKACSCGEKSEIKSHTEGTWTVVTQPTEEKEGQKKTNCTVCKHELKRAIPKSTHTWNAGVVTTEPTCTDDGVKTYTCTGCGTTKTENIEALGHSWSRTSGTATTRTEGTTTYECADCNETKTETGKRAVPSTAVSLDTLGAKSIIADSDLESYGVSTESIPPKITGAIYYKFGVYPQTIKAAEVTIDETIINLEFDAMDYYLGSDNNWYAKCIETAYDSDYTYSDGTVVAKKTANSIKYFKVEPIVWRKLDGSGYLLAEKILTANVVYYPYDEVKRMMDSDSVHAYYVYPNNYEHSRIRAFLNGYKYISKESDTAEQIDNDDFYNKGFLHTAFTQSQRNQIQTTEVDNSLGEKYACSNTQDKIFLLSAREVCSTSNGFVKKSGSDDAQRKRRPTDYAKANFTYQGLSGVGTWQLRTPDTNRSDEVEFVSISGTNYGSLIDSREGVVPALAVVE